MIGLMTGLVRRAGPHETITFGIWDIGCQNSIE